MRKRLYATACSMALTVPLPAPAVAGTVRERADCRFGQYLLEHPDALLHNQPFSWWEMHDE